MIKWLTTYKSKKCQRYKKWNVKHLWTALPVGETIRSKIVYNCKPSSLKTLNEIQIRLKSYSFDVAIILKQVCFACMKVLHDYTNLWYHQFSPLSGFFSCSRKGQDVKCCGCNWSRSPSLRHRVHPKGSPPGEITLSNKSTTQIPLPKC